MSLTMEEKNAMLRHAVEQRREAQAAGKPHEEWYTNEFTQAEIDAGRHRVTEPLPERQIAADLLHDATRLTDDELARQIEDHHLHRAGLTQDDMPTISDDAIDRFYQSCADRLTGDGIQHVQRPGSLPFLELLEELRTLHLSKSQDYGSESDPLANIRQGAEFVGIEPWRGCMVRVADKVQRLRTYCRTGRLVHEGVRDTLLDLAAYSLLAIVLFDEGKDA